MNSIITFYSFKGGVGRTMALANIAVLLVRMGKRVLAVDWDIEAPGLHKFFRDFDIKSQRNQEGLLDLLIHHQEAYRKNEETNWRDYVCEVDLSGKHPLSLLTSGRQDNSYAGKVLAFDWNLFFSESNGGDFIESLRDDWHEEYDVTLIDSRTGITDSGGVCTIQLPDILVPVFTTNEQSLYGAIDVALRAQEGRQELAYDRMPLLVFPLPSRFDGRTEYKESKLWLDRFATETGLFYSDWLPESVSPLQIIERTKLPYIAYFSFGEKLPVVIEGVSDPEGLGYAYKAAASLIAEGFGNAELLICPEPLAVRLIESNGVLNQWLTSLRRVTRHNLRMPIVAAISLVITLSVPLLILNTSLSRQREILNRRLMLEQAKLDARTKEVEFLKSSARRELFLNYVQSHPAYFLITVIVGTSARIGEDLILTVTDSRLRTDGPEHAVSGKIMYHGSPEFQFRDAYAGSVVRDPQNPAYDMEVVDASEVSVIFLIRKHK